MISVPAHRRTLHDGEVLATIVTERGRARVDESVPRIACSDSGRRTPLRPGTRVDSCEILHVLDQGGCALVYRAFDRMLGQTVALKEYMPASIASRTGSVVRPRSARHADAFDGGLRAFMEESRRLARFRHAGLPTLHRAWTANGTAYIQMPCYVGSTLARTLAHMSAPPSERWLKSLLARLLDALEVVHADGSFHCDIAPDNILTLSNGEPLLLDFGAACDAASSRVQPATMIYKRGYAALEQCVDVPHGKGPWTDLYGLAAVVYFAMTGKAPVPSAARRTRDPLVPLARSHRNRFSRSFLSALDCALAVDPQARPQNVPEFRHRLGLSKHECDETRHSSPQCGTPALPQAPTPPAVKRAPAGAVR